MHSLCSMSYPVSMYISSYHISKPISQIKCGELPLAWI